MKLPQSIVVAPFAPCGEGLRTLRPLRLGEKVASGELDVCVLNDGIPLKSLCTFCFSKGGSEFKCSTCKMPIYCSLKCQKNDSVLHELECSLAEKLLSISKIPTRSQRLLLRFLKTSNPNSDINFDFKSFDKELVQYLMAGIGVIKKYLTELKADPQELLLTSFQLKCSCFDIDEIGVGYSVALKKINHSCDPNLVAEFSQNSISIFAIKNIPSGDQLTISYANDPNLLKQFYNFQCKCEKCQSLK